MKRLFGILMLTLISLSNHAVNRYVDHLAASGSGDGLSWTNAYLTVDAALSAALPGDIIKVSEGTYATGNFIGYYSLVESVRMYGGYPSAGTIPSFFREMLRNADAYPTLLTGNSAIRVSGALSSATYVDGFQMIGSNVGLQIFNSNSSNDVIAPIFANCTFTGINSGVEINHNAATVIPQFNGCKFTGSHRGLKVRTAANSQLVAPSFFKCEFFANYFGVSLESWTGDMFPKFTNCIIRNNDSYAITNENTGVGSSFGGVCPDANFFDYHPEFINSKFYNNRGILDAMVLIGCSTKTDVSTIFSNCTFNDNSPLLGAPAFNLAENNNLFTSSNGSIVFKMNNCISSSNTLNGVLIQLGTAMRCQVNNSMIEAGSCNSSGNSFDPAYILLDPHPFVHQVTSNSVANNIYVGNPMYVNSNSVVPDLRLQSASSARNAGLNSLVPLNITTDFKGLNRLIEGTVDMGAHEYCPHLGSCYPTSNPSGPTLSKSQDTEQEVTEDPNLEVNIFPNPVLDVLNIDMNGETEVYVKMFNVNGQLMINESFSGGNVQLDFSSYSAGLYTVVVSDQFSQSVHRVVKR